MLPTRFNRSAVSKILKNQKYYSTSVSNESEYTPTPVYPEILDISYEKRLERKKAAVHEEIRNVKTVEEKQIKLNMPKYYGFKCYMFNEHFVPYNSLPLIQHITKTHLIQTDKLPTFYDKIDLEQLSDNLKSSIEELLIFEHEHIKEINHEVSHAEKENIVTNSICRQINRILFNNLSTSSHLKDTEVDYDPRLESFWFAGGMNPPENVRRYRRGQEWRKHTENDPTDRAIQYIGSPVLTLRSDLPLDPVIPFSEAENSDFQVPYFKYDPRVVGTTTEHRHAANVPGHWPGEKKQFGVLSYNNRGYLLERDFGDISESKEAIHRQGILASFGWLNAQANFLGFTTFNDITYPIVSQLCVTNGKFWSFYVYQLNTLLIHSKNITENKKRNICWATPEFKLYEEIKDGKVIGFNPDVLKMLVKFYMNAPQERLGVNLRPFLSNEESVIADYTDDDKRQWLEREYKFLLSNRPRYKLEYEVYNWEKIYKIDHQTRFMEKRRRPFELFKKPSDRKLNDRQPIYIPRALRPHLPRHKGRYAKEYFP